MQPLVRGAAAKAVGVLEIRKTTTSAGAGTGVRQAASKSSSSSADSAAAAADASTAKTAATASSLVGLRNANVLIKRADGLLLPLRVVALPALSGGGLGLDILGIGVPGADADAVELEAARRVVGGAAADLAVARVVDLQVGGALDELAGARDLAAARARVGVLDAVGRVALDVARRWRVPEQRHDALVEREGRPRRQRARPREAVAVRPTDACEVLILGEDEEGEVLVSITAVADILGAFG